MILIENAYIHGNSSLGSGRDGDAKERDAQWLSDPFPGFAYPGGRVGRFGRGVRLACEFVHFTYPCASAGGITTMC
jgi:hypothetical protein